MRISLTPDDDEISAARPQLFLEIVTGVIVAFLALLGLLDGVIRLARGVGLSKLEFALGLLALLGLFGTPLGLLVRHIKKTIWPDTNRVLELSQRFRMPLLISLAVTGTFSIFIHVFAGIAGTGTGASWALWEILVPFVAVISSVVALRWPTIAPKLPFSQSGSGARALGAVIAVQFALVLVLVLAHREPVKDVTKPVKESAQTDTPTTTAATTAPPVDAPKASSGLPLSSPESKAAWRKFDDVMRKRLAKESVEAFEQLLIVDPLAPQDKEVRQAALRLTADVALLRNEVTEKMNTLLSTRMGSVGIDLLFELVETRGGTVAAQDAERMLREDAVRARGTEAMRIAYDLRYASGCDAKKALFDRARSDGDGRAAMELKLLRECRRGNTCCMRGESSLDDLITAIEKKGEN